MRRRFLTLLEMLCVICVILILLSMLTNAWGTYRFRFE